MPTLNATDTQPNTVAQKTLAGLALAVAILAFSPVSNAEAFSTPTALEQISASVPATSNLSTAKTFQSIDAQYLDADAASQLIVLAQFSGGGMPARKCSIVGCQNRLKQCQTGNQNRPKVLQQCARAYRACVKLVCKR